MRSIDISHVLDGNTRARHTNRFECLCACVQHTGSHTHAKARLHVLCRVMSAALHQKHNNTTSMTIVFYANPSQGDNGQRVRVAAAVLCFVAWLYTRVLAYMRSMHADAPAAARHPPPALVIDRLGFVDGQFKPTRQKKNCQKLKKKPRTVKNREGRKNLQRVGREIRCGRLRLELPTHLLARGVTMLRGMCVVLQNLRNRPELNGLRGYVVYVQDDDRLCVLLDESSKRVVVRAEHVLEWESTDTGNVQSFEFTEGTSEEEIDVFVRRFCSTNVVCSDTELFAFIRPHGAQSSIMMSPMDKSLLVLAGRLEHMGKLSRTAMLLGWVPVSRGVLGVVAYINHSSHRARLTTKELYLRHTNKSLVYVEGDKGDR